MGRPGRAIETHSFPTANPSMASSKALAPAALGMAQGHRHCPGSQCHPHSFPWHNGNKPNSNQHRPARLLVSTALVLCSSVSCSHAATSLHAILGQGIHSTWDEPGVPRVKASHHEEPPSQKSRDTADPSGSLLALRSQPRTTELLSGSCHLGVILVLVPPVSRTTLSQLNSLGVVICGSLADLHALGRLPSAGLFNLLPTERARPVALVLTAPAGRYSQPSIWKGKHPPPLKPCSPQVGWVKAPTR